MSGRFCCGIYEDQDNGGCEKRGHGKGHGPCKCTYFHGENHMVDICWDLHWKPIAHQINFQKKENVSQSFSTKGVNSAPKAILVWSRERFVLVHVIRSVPFQDYHYICVCL